MSSVTSHGDDRCDSSASDSRDAAKTDDGMGAPSSALLSQLDLHQQTAFGDLWQRIPNHLRYIHFDLQGPAWTPDVISADRCTQCK